MAHARSVADTASERLVLIPATKNSTTGYKNVAFNRSKRKFKVRVRDGGKQVHFDTAEEAATAYARSEYGRADAAKLLQPRPAPTAAGLEVIRQAEREGLTLAMSSNNSTGYKGVTYHPKERRRKKYQLQVSAGVGKHVTLGYFATAEQAALFYARREAGKDTSDLTALPLPPLPPAPSSAAGTEAVRQAEREGLTLVTSSSSNSGYRGVCYSPKERRSKQYQLHVLVGGKRFFLGYTAEEAALARARHLWETTVRLLEPQPQQAPPQGAAGPSEASSVEEEEDGFDPADTAAAVANSLLSDPPPSASEQWARRRARAAEQAARAEAAAAACAAPPCDDEMEVEQESDSEEVEMEVAAPAVAGVSAAAAAEEALECVICLDDLSSHPEARLQPRDPNGWGATRCCKNLFHYRCLHTWLNDDSEVEMSCGMEPVNTTCPGCRRFVSKSASRMLA